MTDCFVIVPMREKADDDDHVTKDCIDSVRRLFRRVCCLGAEGV